MATQLIAATRPGKWATRYLQCHLVPDALHYKSLSVLNIRAHCSTILQSSVGVVATTANWALALQPPLVMAPARWAIRLLRLCLHLVVVHVPLLPDQITPVRCSTTHQLSVGGVAPTANLVRALLPTSVTPDQPLLQQHLRSIWVMGALRSRSVLAMHTRAQFSTTPLSSVGALVAMVGWVLEPQIIWVMVRVRWATRLQLSTWVLGALLAQSVQALRTHVQCWTTQQ